MSTVSASPAEGRVADRRILVWDLPVRVFHWLMALSFAGAWLTAESERWRLVHVTLGYTLAGLIAFRLVWGLVGPRHARFRAFVQGPAAALRYLRSLFTTRPEHHTGHNPAGGLAIVALLGLGAAVAATGWAAWQEIGGEALGELHEGMASAMLALVLLHIAAVVLSSWRHRENLVASMVTGRKNGPPREGLRRSWSTLGVAMVVAVLGFWWLQWRDAPQPGALGTGAPVHQHAHGGHDEDD